MAYIAKTAFWPRVSNRVFDETVNITGKFVNADGDKETCSAGFLCKKKELMPCEGYENLGPSGSQVTLNNGNSWLMEALTGAVTSEGDGIYACNTYEVNVVEDPVTGNLYKVGANTLGLPAPKDFPCTFTKIVFDGAKIYHFGEGNLSAAIGSNGFVTIANGLLVPAAAAPTAAGTPYFKVLPAPLAEGNAFTEGAEASFGFYDLMACKVDTVPVGG